MARGCGEAPRENGEPETLRLRRGESPFPPPNRAYSATFGLAFRFHNQALASLDSRETTYIPKPVQIKTPQLFARPV